ncbi:WD40 repeat domain-containing protein [Streptomyces pratensis]|uniref:WD40 repeat domain-containing protein n=1 Tax=Streptomyces pratensis TaxID=1169025 RepID=UPI003B75B6F5
MNTLATGGQDTTIRVWDVTDPGCVGPVGRPVRHHEGMVLAVAFSPDGVMPASGSYGPSMWWPSTARSRAGAEFDHALG